MRDFAARQFSGGVARQFNADALDNAQGPWLRLKQFKAELLSGQKMSPTARQALLQAMYDDAAQAQSALHSRTASDEAFANAQGFSLAPYVAPLSRPLPKLPSLGQIPSGSNGYEAGSPAPAAHPQSAEPEHMNRAQLEAEAKRLGIRIDPRTGKVVE